MQTWDWHVNLRVVVLRDSQGLFNWCTLRNMMCVFIYFGTLPIIFCIQIELIFLYTFMQIDCFYTPLYVYSRIWMPLIKTFFRGTGISNLILWFFSSNLVPLCTIQRNWNHNRNIPHAEHAWHYKFLSHFKKMTPCQKKWENVF